MADSPLVSIVVPVYNAAKYLRPTLDSICNQTYRNLEIILVNDGSSDESAAILDEYASKDKRIIIHTQKNAGQAAARNKGIDLAHGDFLQMLDNDDFFEPEMVERMLVQSENQNAEIVVCNSVSETVGTTVKAHGDRHNMILSKKYLNHNCCCPCKDAPHQFFQIFTSCVVWNKLIRMSFIRKYSLRFPVNRDDIFFGYKILLLAERVSIVENDFIRYQIRPNSASHFSERNINLVHEDLADLYEFIKTRDNSRALLQSFRPRAVRTLFWNISNAFSSHAAMYNVINHCAEQFSYLFQQRYSEENDDIHLCASEAVFHPEIQLILPELSVSKYPDLLIKVQHIINLRHAPRVAVRVLYAHKDDRPLPFDLLDYPIAMPVPVPSDATMEESLIACHNLCLPKASVNLWPNCDASPIHQLIRQHKLKLLVCRLKRIFCINHQNKSDLKIKSRLLRTRIATFKILLDIIQ